MIPTMVSFQERLLLRDWVSLNWSGGDIVEIGAFCGASAVAILQGMSLARYRGTLHVYDTFKFPEDEELNRIYRSRIPRILADSFYSEFCNAIAPWDGVRIHHGDARGAQVPESVSLIHLDCSASRDFHKAVGGMFLTKLEIGGTLIQQDYGYEKAPWIAKYMEKMPVKPILQVDTSVYFKVKRQITKEDVELAFN